MTSGDVHFLMMSDCHMFFLSWHSDDHLGYSFPN